MGKERQMVNVEQGGLGGAGIVQYIPGEGFRVKDPGLEPWHGLTVDQAQALCKSIAQEIGAEGEKFRSQWWYGSVTEQVLGLVVQVAPNLIGEDLAEVVGGKDKELMKQYEQAARQLGREVRAVRKFRKLEMIAAGHLSQQDPDKLSKEFVDIGKAIMRSVLIPGQVRFEVSQYLVEDNLEKSVPARVGVMGAHRMRELSRVHGVLGVLIRDLQPSLGSLVLSGDREPRRDLPKAA